MDKRYIIPILLLSALSAFAVDQILTEAQQKVIAKQKERQLYVGKDATEAKMTFSYQVEIDSSGTPNGMQIKKAIEKQLAHLMGPMAEARFKASPKTDHSVTPVGNVEGNGPYVQKYNYSGTIVLQNGVEAVSGNTYEVILPRNPETIFEASQPTNGGFNSCTDASHQEEDAFWYFWNPRNPSCKLVAGEHYDVVKTQYTRIKNTIQTYPDYRRLLRGNKIIISIFMGLDKPWDSNRDPLSDSGRSDVNRSTYTQIRRSLTQLNFTGGGEWTKSKIETFLGSSTWDPLPYVEEFQKKVNRQGLANSSLVVRLFYGHTGINDSNRAFHLFLKNALADSSVVMYNGHSGLGYNINLEAIEENEGDIDLIPSKKDYQIYYFNSCSSYPYYNTMYFNRKKTAQDPKGTKNLDIITNGLATYFHVLGNTNKVVIKAINDWAEKGLATSYQTIAQDTDSNNLLGVNGDEDNPTSAPR